MQTVRSVTPWLIAFKLMLGAFLLMGATSAVTFTTGILTASKAEAVPRRVRRECRGDYKRLCPRYRAGTSRMRNCMRANGSQLSWGCYEALRDYGYVSRGGRSGRRGRRSGRRD